MGRYVSLNSGGDGVTDLVERPFDAEQAAVVDNTQTAVIGDPSGTTPTLAWAPAAPAPKKKRRWLWAAVPAGIAVVGLVASSLILIAPGTAVAGVPVGGLTPGAAADTIAARLAETKIVLGGEGGNAQLTAADLGASVDARALADTAFAEHPLWNVSSWNTATPAVVTLDAEKAAAALRAAAPSVYVDPTDATIEFDAATIAYVATPAVDGTGIDVATVQAALQEAFANGESTVELDIEATPVPALVSTASADATVASLNGILDTAGFYVGTERTVPIDRAVAASWLTFAPDAKGVFEIEADASAIQTVVDGLPALVDRAPVNSVVLANLAGTIISTPTVGATGRTLGATAGIANSYADQLATGMGVFQLPVEEVAFTTATVTRVLEVDLSEQRLYMKENDVVVDSFLISSGKPGAPTFTGRYTVGYKTPVQTMRGTQRNAAGEAVGEYVAKDVQYPMYFNGGQAFHGVYWHNRFGTPLSHGCIGMPDPRAKQVYEWAAKGTDVYIHN